jgi:hypothetical protein
MVSQAWLRYESGAFVGLPSRPAIVHRPHVGETEIELAVDLDDVGYTVNIVLDCRDAEAIAVTMTPEPALGGVALVALAAINALTALEAKAGARNDVRTGDLYSRAIIAMTLWRQGWVIGQIEDSAA